MTNWDKLATHNRPVDRNTANAMKGGCGHDVTLKPVESRRHADVPFAMCEPPTSAPNFIGARRDRLTVIGWLADPGTRQNHARWVVRCDCGAYEARRSKAFRNLHAPDACSRCMKLDWVKRAGSSVRGTPTLVRRTSLGDEA